jgi:hypothetical protein
MVSALAETIPNKKETQINRFRKVRFILIPFRIRLGENLFEIRSQLDTLLLQMQHTLHRIFVKSILYRRLSALPLAQHINGNDTNSATSICIFDVLISSSYADTSIKMGMLFNTGDRTSH